MQGLKTKGPWVLAGCGCLLIPTLGVGGVLYLFFFGVERVIETRPRAVFTVTDTSGQPLAGARLRLEHRSDPHGLLHTSDDYVTSKSGQVRVESRSKTERIHPLFIHGVPAHYYVVCIERKGFRPVHLELNHEKKIDIDVALNTLDAAEPVVQLDCSSPYDARLQSHPRGDLTEAPTIRNAAEFSLR